MCDSKIHLKPFLFPGTECLKHINDGYFYDSTSKLCVHIVKSHGLFNRAQAEQMCKAEGGDLMTVQTEDEQYFLLTWIFSHKGKKRRSF